MLQYICFINTYICIYVCVCVVCVCACVCAQSSSMSCSCVVYDRHKNAIFYYKTKLHYKKKILIQRCHICYAVVYFLSSVSAFCVLLRQSEGDSGSEKEGSGERLICGKEIIIHIVTESDSHLCSHPENMVLTPL